jgi:uncharacterized phage infection (PIP) family protein YhgE
LSNAVNDLGNSNCFDACPDTDSEIGQLGSSSSPVSADDSARIPLQIDAEDVAPLAEVSIDLPQSMQSPRSIDRPWHSTTVRQIDPDRQWRRDALDQSSDCVMSVDADLLQAASTDPLQLDRPPLDVSAELDLLLGALLVTPQPPPLAPPVATNSITNIQSRISTVAPVTHTQQLLQELNDARQQLTAAQTLLQLLNRRNQAQIDRVDAHTQEVKQIKFHTQQLALYSKSQAQIVRESIDAFERIRTQIEIDRLQIVELSAKLDRIDGLDNRLTTMHDRVVEKSQTLQSKIFQIERGFGELSQSIQSEKEQFYALTVETIEKADLLRSQLTLIANQIEDDRATISQLRADIASIHQSTPAQIDRQLDSALAIRDRELLAICHDLQARHHQGVATVKKLSSWLWILSIAVGTSSILLMCIAIGFKRAALF